MLKNMLLLFVALLTSTATAAFNVEAIGKTSNDSIFDSRSCNELYMEITALEKQTYQHQQNHYTDKNAQAASIASAVFTPAFYYFGYAAYKDYKSQHDVGSIQQQMETIRTRMAEKRCFDQR